ncbi:MAG: MBL fold metallo-hydrolase [Candidatus Bathyarchaeota archaeon]|nr:MBL fold metallo-hydrolase [Candidatus Bathyarchaeota archaeon]
MTSIVNETLELAEVDNVEILSLVDNSVDFLSTQSKAEVQTFRQWTNKKYGQKWTNTHNKLPVAEHGFSILVRLFRGEKFTGVLFDTGNSSNGITENAKRMRVDLSEVEYVILSHGHYDHTGGLLSALKTINKPNIRLILHEDMFKTRGLASVDGKVKVYPKFPPKRRLTKSNIVETKKPKLIADAMALVTGEIPRQTSYEKGVLNHMALVEGSWQPDPWIWDDRAIVIKVKGKGLVILSGCAHSGIINTISYAKTLTGVSEVYAIIGGFHLAGAEFENRIQQTVKELKKAAPKLIAPSHCTGWRAICAIAEALKEEFVWNSVGNLYRI